MTPQANKAMPDPKQCPGNLCLINNVEDVVVFLGLKVLNSENFFFSCSRNAQVTFVEKTQLKIIRFPKYKH